MPKTDDEFEARRLLKTRGERLAAFTTKVIVFKEAAALGAYDFARKRYLLEFYALTIS